MVGLIVTVNYDSYKAKMNHLIICALVDTFTNEWTAPMYIRHRLGKDAENAIKGMLKQHWAEYKKLQKG